MHRPLSSKPRTLAPAALPRSSGTARLRIAKWGNCLAVRIPKDKARETGLELGAEVSVERVAQGVLLRPLRRRPTLKELVRRITPANRHGAIDLGPAVGKEVG